MKSLHKTLLAVAAVVSLGLGTVAIASPWGGMGGMGGGACPMMGMGMGGPMMGGGPKQHRAMMQQFHAERMELLAARLKLKPEQEAVWNAFLAAQDAHHKAMFQGQRAMMMRDRETTALAHFETRLQGMEQNLASMKAMVKAAGDLYAALDPTQKQVMDKFFTKRPAWMKGGRGGQGPAAMPGQPGAAAAPAMAPPADANDDDDKE